MIILGVNGTKREMLFGSVGVNGKNARIKKVIIGKENGNHLVWEYYVYPIGDGVKYSGMCFSGDNVIL